MSGIWEYLSLVLMMKRIWVVARVFEQFWTRFQCDNGRHGNTIKANDEMSVVMLMPNGTASRQHRSRKICSCVIATNIHLVSNVFNHSLLSLFLFIYACYNYRCICLFNQCEHPSLFLSLSLSYYLYPTHLTAKPTPTRREWSKPVWLGLCKDNTRPPSIKHDRHLFGVYNFVCTL